MAKVEFRLFLGWRGDLILSVEEEERSQTEKEKRDSKDHQERD